MGFWRDGPSYVLIAISFILFLIACASMVDSYMYSGSVIATIVNTSCTLATGSLSRYHCNLTVSYVVDNQTCQAAITMKSSLISYAVGDHITIYYNPRNIHAVIPQKPRLALSTAFFFVITLLLFVYSITFYFHPKWTGLMGLFYSEPEKGNRIYNPNDLIEESKGMFENPYRI